MTAAVAFKLESWCQIFILLSVILSGVYFFGYLFNEILVYHCNEY